MNKSAMQRLFPQPSGSLLPQHEQSQPRHRQTSRYQNTAPPRVVLGNSSHSDTPNSEISFGNRSTIRAPPLTASLIHSDDPFLPIERAARALQETIQSLLDIQSSALTGRLDGVEPEDVKSNGSATPTQSVVSAHRSATSPRTVPVRQPVTKKISLRGARKGLSRSMREFAKLRGEELRVLDLELRARSSALSRVEDFEQRKKDLSKEIQTIKSNEPAKAASNLRQEANGVRIEIEELEHRLLELKVRHQHLTMQAEQIESSMDSKASSYQNTLSLINREVKDFLRRPPIPHAITGDIKSAAAGMYALKPERRTLEMAKDQWTGEHDVITKRRSEVEDERKALVEGERMWTAAVSRISEFEQDMRTQNQLLARSTIQDTLSFAASNNADQTHGSTMLSMQQTLKRLSSVIEMLESDLSQAESQSWNLLICAVGAELEAFYQARELLQSTQKIANEDTNMRTGSDPANLLDGQMTELALSHSPDEGRQSPTSSERSNQSLKDTLAEFREDSLQHSKAPTKGVERRYESEDDEPPHDFLISQ